MLAALSTPAPLRILERLANGGMVAEFPILRCGTLDLSLAAKGSGTLAVTREMLDEIVANSAAWPGPLPLNVAPHRDWNETSGAAPGFIDALVRRGDDLVARCTLGPGLSMSIDAGEWRGFSVDLAKNAKLPSRSFAGWCVTGGVFTNRPAAAVNFSVEQSAAAEASAEIAFAVHVSLSEHRIPSPAIGAEYGARVAALAIKNAASRR